MKKYLNLVLIIFTVGFSIAPQPISAAPLPDILSVSVQQAACDGMDIQYGVSWLGGYTKKGPVRVEIDSGPAFDDYYWVANIPQDNEENYIRFPESKRDDVTWKNNKAPQIPLGPFKDGETYVVRVWDGVQYSNPIHLAVSARGQYKGCQPKITLPKIMKDVLACRDQNINAAMIIYYDRPAKVIKNQDTVIRIKEGFVTNLQEPYWEKKVVGSETLKLPGVWGEELADGASQHIISTKNGFTGVGGATNNVSLIPGRTYTVFVQNDDQQERVDFIASSCAMATIVPTAKVPVEPGSQPIYALCNNEWVDTISTDAVDKINFKVSNGSNQSVPIDPIIDDSYPFGFKVVKNNLKKYIDNLYTIVVSALDSGGKEYENNDNVYFVKLKDDLWCNPLQVSFTGPPSGTTLKTQTDIKVKTQGGSGKITGVDLYLDRQHKLLITDTTKDLNGYYTFSFNPNTLKAGKHTFVAVANDQNGRRARTDVLTLNFVSSVSITSPVANQTVSGTVPIKVRITNIQEAVSRVEFYYKALDVPGSDFKLFGTDQSSAADADGSLMYEYPLNADSLPAGNYLLRAVALDATNKEQGRDEVSVMRGAGPLAITTKINKATDQWHPGDLVFDSSSATLNVSPVNIGGDTSLLLFNASFLPGNPAKTDLVKKSGLRLYVDNKLVYPKLYDGGNPQATGPKLEYAWGLGSVKPGVHQITIMASDLTTASTSSVPVAAGSSRVAPTSYQLKPVYQYLTINVGKFGPQVSLPHNSYGDGELVKEKLTVYDPDGIKATRLTINYKEVPACTKKFDPASAPKSWECEYSFIWHAGAIGVGEAWDATGDYGSDVWFVEPDGTSGNIADGPIIDLEPHVVPDPYNAASGDAYYQLDAHVHDVSGRGLAKVTIEPVGSWSLPPDYLKAPCQFAAEPAVRDATCSQIYNSAWSGVGIGKQITIVATDNAGNSRRMVLTMGAPKVDTESMFSVVDVSGMAALSSSKGGLINKALAATLVKRRVMPRSARSGTQLRLTTLPIKTPDSTTGVIASDGTYPDKITVDFKGGHAGAGTFRLYAAFNDGSVKCTSEFYTGLEKKESNSLSGRFDFTATTQTAGRPYNFAVGEVGLFGLIRCLPEHDSGYRQARAAPVSTANPRFVPAPTSLIASDGSYPDKVVLSWNAAPNLATGFRYDVYRKGADNVWGYLASVNSTTYTDTTAAANTSYLYRVFATGVVDGVARYSANSNDDAGSRSFSTADVYLSISGLPNTPNVPLTVTPAATKCTQSANSVLTCQYPLGTTASLKVTASGYTFSPDTLQISNLQQTKYFSVTATKVKAEAPAPTPSPTTTTIPAPTNLRASDGSYTDRVTLNWYDPVNRPSGSHYDIYRVRAPGSNSSPWVYLASVNDPWYNDNSAEPISVYDYRVFTVLGTQYSVTIQDSGFRAGSPTQTPAAPTLTVNGNTLSWNNVGVGIKYDVYNGSNRLVAGQDATTYANATPGTYQVAAVNYNNSSPRPFAMSNTVVVELPATTPAPNPITDVPITSLGAPTNFTALGDANKIHIAWTEPAGGLPSGAHYDVYRSSGSDRWDYFGSFTSTSYDDTTAVPGTWYSYRAFTTGTFNGVVLYSPNSNSASSWRPVPVSVVAPVVKQWSQLAGAWAAVRDILGEWKKQ
jgi:hypothetical protein